MNKTILITGGSRGLGKEMALSVAKEGNDVILTYHTKKQEAEGVVSEIKKLGRNAVALQLDVYNSDSISDFANDVKRYLEVNNTTLYALVNNAGTGSYEPISDTAGDQIDRLYTMHFKSVFLLAKEFSTIIPEGGSIINISSGYSRFSAVGFSVYGAMKGAIDTLTRFQALEFAPFKIRVNAIAPGAIETDFAGGIVRDNADINNFVANQTALARTGQPDDIGSVVAFMISDAAKWINGQRIEVSGGIYL
ncbi:SDR family oxidoreductase [Pedobacter frigidisoli]|uniref:SDR family NAD(P)-dependent oxidoreductase n=1 Tax=Pedobacter frigidisoli TaxID=2530455 RepID=UPI00292CC64E|nr:SDR family oxidoreductase [Pedobacter frigidisoli]